MTPVAAELAARGFRVQLGPAGAGGERPITARRGAVAVRLAGAGAPAAILVVAGRVQVLDGAGDGAVLRHALAALDAA